MRNISAKSSIYKISSRVFSDTDSTYDNCSSKNTFAFDNYKVLLDRLNIVDQHTETLFYIYNQQNTSFSSGIEETNVSISNSLIKNLTAITCITLRNSHL